MRQFYLSEEYAARAGGVVRPGLEVVPVGGRPADGGDDHDAAVGGARIVGPRVVQVLFRGGHDMDELVGIDDHRRLSVVELMSFSGVNFS